MTLKNLILPGILVGAYLAFKNLASDVDISNQFTIAPGSINFKGAKAGLFSSTIYPEIEITNPTSSSTTIDSISGQLIANGKNIGSYYINNVTIAPGVNIIKLPTKISTLGTLTTLVNYFTKGIGKAVTLGTTGILNKGAFNFKFSEVYKLTPGKGVNGIGKRPELLEWTVSHNGGAYVTTSADLGGRGIKQSGNGSDHKRGLKTYHVTEAAFNKLKQNYNTKYYSNSDWD